MPDHEPGPYVCLSPDCRQTFPSVRSRAAHLKKHSRGVECPVCHEFVRQLSTHIRREHPDDDLDQLEQLVRRLVDELRDHRSQKPGSAASSS